ncbi:hypothetical protein C1878_09330 [Gordonibacter sp. 28C]|uniref:anaerobic ribonucleoside-triphosphate reductase n=1 Tax=Gordonibacter sp. 28C TaxID=2078569 RepID=UPI000DF74637|nr:anaerobic ribonucleoside-triphosphate reductase [Gordonibacter sp. 28C]RDB62008.1 hypothetical protein C1878_09330 [Gordonibacter sp. 28C]
MAQHSELKVSGVDVTVVYANEDDQPVTTGEVEAYVARAHEQHPHQVLSFLKLDVDGEDVGISYGFEPEPFDRIRRITGYLVGTMDRWNDAKTAEESDRVKHGISRDERSFTCASGC